MKSAAQHPRWSIFYSCLFDTDGYQQPENPPVRGDKVKNTMHPEGKHCRAYFHTKRNSNEWSIIYFGHPHFIPSVGVGKERRTLIGPWWCKGSSHYWNYLEDYWPCAGGLSPAVNAIGTQLRDPINSGLARWRIMLVS